MNGTRPSDLISLVLDFVANLPMWRLTNVQYLITMFLIRIIIAEY